MRSVAGNGANRTVSVRPLSFSQARAFSQILAESLSALRAAASVYAIRDLHAACASIVDVRDAGLGTPRRGPPSYRNGPCKRVEPHGQHGRAPYWK